MKIIIEQKLTQIWKRTHKSIKLVNLVRVAGSSPVNLLEDKCLDKKNEVKKRLEIILKIFLGELSWKEG